MPIILWSENNKRNALMSLSSPIRIALVDDHSLVRDGIRALLAVMAPLEVVGEAESGADAIEMVSRTKPDLLLVDISLKDMNGLELTRTLRREYPSIKILILSMYDNYEYVSESVRSGASGYVLKNAPSREIIAAIEAIASGGTFYSAEIASILAADRHTDSELTPRESQVLCKMVQGLNNKEMARELDISVRTVETHRLSIRRKLNIDKPAALLNYAIEHGLISR
jgi:DNA-binding NarL/FixJ family response regulator